MALDKGADSKKHLSPESDMTMLASLLTKSEEEFAESESADDSRVAELLNRLTAADGVAQGVEERLNGIIENLDMLLSALEKASSDELLPETSPDEAKSSAAQSRSSQKTDSR